MEERLVERVVEREAAPAAVLAIDRRMILMLLMAFAALGHFNRNSISVAGNGYLMKDYGLSPTQMGWVYSSFLIVYTASMLPSGLIIDRIGSYRALLTMGVASSMLVMLTGAVSMIPKLPATQLLWGLPAALVALIAIRSVLGSVYSPLHPGAARAVSLWMPQRERGLANGLVTGAAVMGVASVFYVFGTMMDKFGGPAAFALSGGAALALSAAWLFLGDDRLARQGAAAAIRQQPTGQPEAGLEDRTRGIAKGAANSSVWQSPSLWLLAISYGAYSYHQYMFFYWIEYYFDKVLKVGDASRTYSTIVLLAMTAGMLAGGWLGDRSQQALGPVWGRRLIPIVGMIFAAVFTLMGVMAQNTAMVVFLVSLALGSAGLCESAFWVTGIELGRRNAGTSGAILNTVGNAGGFISPALTPMLADKFGWTAGLAVASAMCLVSAALWLAITPERNPSDA